MRKCRPRNSNHPEHVDLEHSAPFVERVRLDRALCADAGVVDHDIDAAHGLGGLPDGTRYGVVVRHVGAMTGCTDRGCRRVEVEHRDQGAAGEGCRGHRMADA
jgi:hypothetical protein